VIATNEAADVLRHGWQDAASTLAADIPEVGELLQARLEMAIASQRLDERHLLDTIEEVESISSRAGSPASDELAVRLRRTVYEFLLALDATQPPDNKALLELSPTSDGPMVGAEEVAALGHATELRGTGSQAPPAKAVEAMVEDTVKEADNAVGAESAEPVSAGEASEDAAAEIAVVIEADGQVVEATAGQTDEAAAPEPGAAATETVTGDAEPGDPSAFMAPRAGFHIGDDGIVVPGAGGGDDAPLTMPAFESDGSAPADENSEFLTWRHATREGDADEVDTPVPAELGTPPPIESPAATVAGTAQGPVAPAVASGGHENDEERGWRVRRPGEGHTPRVVVPPPPEEDPFEGNAKLSETRRRIEDRLRRKRCDEAASLLQALARETGGRHVAELAMNAGDRCRALGKSNAALNCYLAASRSDPVYEMPLSRLADICIDDKETDLAVSYLERIARLYRFRGDETAALRVYRRIATIAPYREDVLNVLMQAQRTGRLEV
jgi:hypothetical protein